jgi:hypothetical protein
MKPITNRYPSASDGPKLTQAEQQSRLLTWAAYEANCALPVIFVLMVMSGLLSLVATPIGLLSLLSHGWKGGFTCGLAAVCWYLAWELWQLHRAIFALYQSPAVHAMIPVVLHIRNVFVAVASFFLVWFLMHLAIRMI